jgi:hypothetical protein
MDFRRGSAADFKEYSDQLRSKADGAHLSATLRRKAQQFRGAVQTAEKWIADAQIHVHRISDVKAYYQKLEDHMRSLVAQERTTNNYVARSQVSVSVIQGNTAGIQATYRCSRLGTSTFCPRGGTLGISSPAFPRTAGFARSW